MQSFWQDVRYALRTFKKNLAGTVIAVLAAALGIGGATLMFSSADATLLRPFSFPNQDRLLVLFEQNPDIGVTRAALSPGNVVAWRAEAQTLSDIVVLRSREFVLHGDGPPERYTSNGVSAQFFEALGVKPLLGRTFRRGEDEAGRAQVAVLKYGFWQQRFGGDPQVVGKQVLLDEKPYEIVGVMPKDFDFPLGGAVMWTPFVIESAMQQEHTEHYLRALGLLKPGVSAAQANAELQAISQRIQQRFPQGEAGHTGYAVTLNAEYTRGAKMYVPILAASAFFVLLIACSNVANLLLARATTRQREIAVRLALGATRWRLLRQLLTESVLLGLMGGVLGCVLAAWGIDALADGIPPEMSKYIPGWNHLGLNYSVLAFAVLVSVLTGVLFGLAPAWQASKTSLNDALKDGGNKGAPGGRSTMRNALVVVELSLSLILLIGAGLLVRSFIALLRADLGVNPNAVVTMSLELPTAKYADPQARRNFFNQLLQRVASLPGVVQASAASTLPINGYNNGSRFRIVGQPVLEKSKEPQANFRIITPDYFAAIGTPLRQGRVFSASDDAQAAPVVLVNESFVARYLKGSSPLGQRISLGNESEKSCEIVGVVASAMSEDLNELEEPTFYLPFAQHPAQDLSLIVRAPGAETSVVPSIRQELATLDPLLPLADVKTMTQIIEDRRSPKSLMMWMLVIFGVQALAMAAVGTYAVMAYAVSQRTHEFGVRIALGAQRRDILGLVLRRGLWLALLGTGIGLTVAFALTRTLGQFLYGVSATDPLTFGGVTLLLLAVTLLACYLPARRATNVDPMIALRCE